VPAARRHIKVESANRKTHKMTECWRAYFPGGSWFFTVNLAKRKTSRLLVEKIGLLRNAFEYTKQRYPFRIDAVVILPDHLHCIWTLPQVDADIFNPMEYVERLFFPVT